MPTSATPITSASSYMPVIAAPVTPLHTISLLVRNKPGVLVRIALVFARRGYNIESLVVSGDVTNSQLSRMTITCSGDLDTLEQIIKQLTKLIDVVHAFDHTGQPVIETEVALVKLACAVTQRTEILQIGDQFGAKVVDYGGSSMILRIYGTSDKLDSCLALLQPYKIVELVRSGKILMARGVSQT